LSELENYLRELCLLPGLSGHEQAVSRYMGRQFEQFGLRAAIDILGNTVAAVEGTDAAAPSVLITAHMDQLGFVVKTILDDGYLKLERVGGIPEKALPTLRVSVQTDDGDLINGIIGVKSHHLTPAEEKYKVEPYTSLYVDIGCASKREVLDLGVNIGSPVVYRPFFECMRGTRRNGTSFDNRAACAVVLTLTERIAAKRPRASVYIAGTVQEEFTVRGAVLAARAVRPELCFCLDVAMAGDTPDLRGVNDVKLGGGPVLSLYNFHGRGTLNGVMPHPAMVRLLTAAADKTGIPLQRVASLGILTELSHIQTEGAGLCGADLDIPCRYTHTQAETCDLNDLEQTVCLLEEAVRSVDAGFDRSR